MKSIPLWRVVVTCAILSLKPWLVVAQQPQVSLPTLVSVHVPRYPQVAQFAKVEGVVNIRVTTDGRRVVSTQIEDGHKLLAEPAERNVRTWEFSAHEPTTFTVTYTFKLIENWQGDPNNPIVVLRLPTEVEVSARRVYSLH